MVVEVTMFMDLVVEVRAEVVQEGLVVEVVQVLQDHQDRDIMVDQMLI
jgi:hypothetical protein